MRKEGKKTRAVEKGNKESSDWRNSCFNCRGKHEIRYCKEFIALTLEEKKDYARQKRLCLRCLKKGHMGWHCQEEKICDICEGHYLTFMHDENTVKAKEAKQKTNIARKEQPSEEVGTL